MAQTPPTAAPAARPHTRLYRFALSATLLITAAIYLQAAFFEFVYDDLGQIVYNPLLKSWGGALGYFKTHVWAQSSDLVLYYRPVYMLWLEGNRALFGLKPLSWHLAAIAVHLVACLLLYFFVSRLTQDKWVAVVSVLLFGLHPAHVESVAWISGTTESLMASLLVASLLCYLNYREPGKTKAGGWFMFSLILAFLAMLVKETALILPALVLTYEWIFPERKTTLKMRVWRAIRAAVPFAILSCSFLLLRALALKNLTPPAAKGRLYLVLAWPQAIAFYISHALFPTRLSAFYNRMTVSQPEFRNFVLPIILMLVGTAVLCYGSRRSRVFAFLSLWCAITMVPLLNVTLWNNVENVHDRYLYLPSVAVCVMLASLLSRLKELHHDKTALAALVAIAGGYALMTVHELQYWRNDSILGQRGVAISPGHPIAPQLVGHAYLREGKIYEAIPYLTDALTAKPDSFDTLCSLAFCYSEINALGLAEEYALKAIACKSSYGRAHLVLGIVRFKQNRLDEAETEIRGEWSSST